MTLNVFTHLPPCTEISNNKRVMEFYGKTTLSTKDRIECSSFFGEMALDKRINMLRETLLYKNWVPEEESHTICLWLKDSMGGYYSPGKMTIDDTYIISNGGHKVLYTFQRSFNTEGKKPFQYVYTSKDSKEFGDFLIILRNTLMTQGYKASKTINVDNSLINVIDNRL